MARILVGFWRQSTRTIGRARTPFISTHDLPVSFLPTISEICSRWFGFESSRNRALAQFRPIGLASQGVAFATRMSALTGDLGGSFGSFAMGATKAASLGGSTTTCGITAFLRVGHRSSVQSMSYICRMQESTNRARSNRLCCGTIRPVARRESSRETVFQP